MTSEKMNLAELEKFLIDDVDVKADRAKTYATALLKDEIDTKVKVMEVEEEELKTKFGITVLGDLLGFRVYKKRALGKSIEEYSMYLHKKLSLPPDDFKIWLKNMRNPPFTSIEKINQ